MKSKQQHFANTPNIRTIKINLTDNNTSAHSVCPRSISSNGLHNSPMPVIVVDGIIAAGKSTLIKYISAELKKRGVCVVVMDEPIDKWVKSGELATLYSNVKRWGFTFQIMALHDRLTMLEAAKNKCLETKAHVLIADRSIYSDRYFAKVLHDNRNMSDAEYKLYMNMWQRFEGTQCLKPTHFVYLRPPLSVCMTRIRRRNRPSEAGITAKYQQQLMTVHDEYLRSGAILANGCYLPAIVFDYKGDITTNTDVAINVVDRLFEF